MSRPHSSPAKEIRLASATPAEKAADRIISTLHREGFEAYRVGGAVRDRLLGRIPAEVDVATNAVPAKVRQLFPRTYAVGESFGVVIVHGEDGVDVEVATFREEQEYADGRHPAEVHYSTAVKDAERRDFTINALFYDPDAGVVLDFVAGLEDLRGGRIRAIGNAAARFQEDHLRLLRSVRFAAELGFDLTPETRQAVAACAVSLQRISSERIAGELTRMLTGRDPARAFALLHDLGLLAVCLPEVDAMTGVPQPPQFHPEGDVWEHTLLMLNLLRWPAETLAWATLLHDVGKPTTHEFSNGRDRFPCHCEEGAKMGGEILRRLRFPRRTIEAVTACIDNHMRFMHVQEMRESTLRRFMGRPTFALELELHRLDCVGSHGKLDNYVFLLDTLQRFENEPVMPKPLVTGDDVMALGVREGPEVGRLLRMAQEWQLNGEVQGRDETLERLRSMLADQAPGSGEKRDRGCA